MAERIDNTPKSNLSPNTFLELFRELGIAQREIDAATGRKRAILKRAKAAGIDLDALALMQRLAKLETDEAAMRLRNLARYSAWANMPIGTQADLFGATDDQRPTEKAQAEHNEWQADDAGYQAGKAGDSIDNNPHPAGTPFYDRWRQGWHKGQEVLAHKLAANAAEEDDKPVVAPVAQGRRRKGAEARRNA